MSRCLPTTFVSHPFFFFLYPILSFGALPYVGRCIQSPRRQYILSTLSSSIPAWAQGLGPELVHACVWGEVGCSSDSCGCSASLLIFSSIATSPKVSLNLPVASMYWNSGATALGLVSSVRSDLASLLSLRSSWHLCVLSARQYIRQ